MDKDTIINYFYFYFCKLSHVILQKSWVKRFFKNKKKSLALFYKHINQKLKHSATIISRSINVNVGLVISLCHYLPCSQVTQFCSHALFSRVLTRETKIYSGFCIHFQLYKWSCVDNFSLLFLFRCVNQPPAINMLYTCRLSMWRVWPSANLHSILLVDCDKRSVI